jgi:hypothetical protein
VGGGLALDCQGDPIYVPQPQSMVLDEKCDPHIPTPLWVVLCGTEKCCSPRTSMCASDEDESPSVCTREREYFEIRIVRTRPHCACSCPEPDPKLPDVPTTREAGLPHLLGGFWSGLVAPAGTPSDIVETINSAANEAMRSQEMQSAMETLGASQQLGTPAEFGAFISAESRKWTEIVRASGIRMD